MKSLLLLHELYGSCDDLKFLGHVVIGVSQICTIRADKKAKISDSAKRHMSIIKNEIGPSLIVFSDGESVMVGESVDYIYKLQSQIRD